MDLRVNKDALSFYNDSFATICATMDIAELNKAFNCLNVSRQREVSLFQNSLSNGELRRLPLAFYQIINYKNNLTYILNSLETSIEFYNKCNLTLPFMDRFDLLKHKTKHSATEFISGLKILNRH